MTMSNAFVNSKAIKLFAAKMLDAAPYLKASKGYFSGDFKGKKSGRTYTFYLTDAGNPTDGIKIQSTDDDSVEQREVAIQLKHKKTLVSLDVLESIVDIASFKDEIAEPYGVRLGAELQKDSIEYTYFQGSTCFVNSNGWKAMAGANAHLRSIRQGAKTVGFMDPTVSANLTVDALNGWMFTASQKGQDFYGDASIGKFHGTEYVEVTDTPMVAGKTLSLTIASAAPSSDVNNVGGIKLTLSGAAGADIPVGTPLKLAGAKACNVVGMPTNADFICFVQKKVESADTSIEVGRIELADIGSRNCFIEGAKELDDLADVVLTNVLENGKNYFAVQTRTEDVMEFEKVPMADLEGAKTESATVGGIELKVTTAGEFDELKNRTRWDIEYANGIVDNRLVSIAFVEA